LLCVQVHLDSEPITLSCQVLTGGESVIGPLFGARNGEDESGVESPRGISLDPDHAIGPR
jgi:hypothetical protein